MSKSNPMATLRKTQNTSKKSMNNKTQKQQPFSDISNFNLIPTSTLRKFCSTSSSASSSSSKLVENVIPKSDSNTTKPNFNNSPNNNYSTSVASDTSVASSNFNPLRNPIGRDDEAVVYNRKQTTKKSNVEANVLSLGSNLRENKENKTKAIAEPFVSLSPTSTKDKGKAIAETFSSSSSEIEKDKRKGVAVLSTPVSGNKKTKGIHEPFIPDWDNEVVVYRRRKDPNEFSSEANALPFTSSLHENKKDIRKEITEPFLSVPPTITKAKGKAVAEPLNGPSPEFEKHKGKGVAILSAPVSGNKKKKGIHIPSLHENKKDKWKEIAEPFLSLPPPSTKDKGKAIAESFRSSSPEFKEDKGKGVAVQSTPVSGHKKKGIQEPFMSSSPKTVKAKAKAISLEQAPSDEKTAEENVGDLSLSLPSLKKTRRKERADTSVFSCPTLPKKRNNRTEVNRAGGIKPSGSWTDANAKRTKRWYTEQKAAAGDSLPQDFINYWKEHYKAVDEFELPEEEVSDCDLD